LKSQRRRGEPDGNGVEGKKTVRKEGVSPSEGRDSLNSSGAGGEFSPGRKKKKEFGEPE